MQDKTEKNEENNITADRLMYCYKVLDVVEEINKKIHEYIDIQLKEYVRTVKTLTPVEKKYLKKFDIVVTTDIIKECSDGLHESIDCSMSDGLYNYHELLPWVAREFENEEDYHDLIDQNSGHKIKITKQHALFIQQYFQQTKKIPKTEYVKELVEKIKNGYLPPDYIIIDNE